MLQQYHTKLKGTLALTDSYLTEKALQKEKGLYKFIWVRNGSITVEIDHQEMVLAKDEVISLTHLQHLEFKSIDGEYLTLLFNSNFYAERERAHRTGYHRSSIRKRVHRFRQFARRNAAHIAEAVHHPVYPDCTPSHEYYPRKRIRFRDCTPIL